jgi:hypothetical protein
MNIQQDDWDMLKLKKKKERPQKQTVMSSWYAGWSLVLFFWHVAISVSEQLTELLKKKKDMYGYLPDNLIKKIIVNLNLFSLLSIHFPLIPI